MAAMWLPACTLALLSLLQVNGYSYDRYPQSDVADGPYQQPGYYPNQQSTYNSYQQPSSSYNPYPGQTTSYNPYQQTSSSYNPYPGQSTSYNPYQQTTSSYNSYPGQSTSYNPYQQTSSSYNPYPEQSTPYNPYQQQSPAYPQNGQYYGPDPQYGSSGRYQDNWETPYQQNDSNQLDNQNQEQEVQPSRPEEPVSDDELIFSAQPYLPAGQAPSNDYLDQQQLDQLDPAQQDYVLAEQVPSNEYLAQQQLDQPAPAQQDYLLAEQVPSNDYLDQQQLDQLDPAQQDYVLAEQVPSNEYLAQQQLDQLEQAQQDYLQAEQVPTYDYLAQQQPDPAQQDFSSLPEAEDVALPFNCPFHQEPISLAHPTDTIHGTVNQEGNYAFDKIPGNVAENIPGDKAETPVSFDQFEQNNVKPFDTESPELPLPFVPPPPDAELVPEQENDPIETRMFIGDSNVGLEKIKLAAEDELKESDLKSKKNSRSARNSVGGMSLEAPGLVYGNHMDDILYTQDHAVKNRRFTRSLFSSLIPTPSRVLAPAAKKINSLGQLALWPKSKPVAKEETIKTSSFWSFGATKQQEVKKREPNLQLPTGSTTASPTEPGKNSQEAKLSFWPFLTAEKSNQEKLNAPKVEENESDGTEQKSHSKVDQETAAHEVTDKTAKRAEPSITEGDEAIDVLESAETATSKMEVKDEGNGEENVLAISPISSAPTDEVNQVILKEEVTTAKPDTKAAGTTHVDNSMVPELSAFEEINELPTGQDEASDNQVLLEVPTNVPEDVEPAFTQEMELVEETDPTDEETKEHEVSTESVADASLPSEAKEHETSPQLIPSAHITSDEQAVPEQDEVTEHATDAEPDNTQVDQTSSQPAAIDQRNGSVIITDVGETHAREPAADVIKMVDGTGEELSAANHITLDESVEPEGDEEKRPLSAADHITLDESVEPEGDKEKRPDEEPAMVAVPEIAVEDQASSEVPALGQPNEAVAPKAEETDEYVENHARETISDEHDNQEMDQTRSGSTVDYITLGDSLKSEDEETLQPVVDKDTVTEADQTSSEVAALHPKIESVVPKAGEAREPKENNAREKIVDEDEELATVAEAGPTSSEVAALDTNNESDEPKVEEAREPIADVRDTTEVDGKSSGPIVDYITLGESVKSEDEEALQPVLDAGAGPTSSEVVALDPNNEAAEPEAEEAREHKENNTREPLPDVHDSKQVDQLISEPTVSHVTSGESFKHEEEALQPVLDDEAEPATAAEAYQISSHLAALDPNNEAVEPEAEEAGEPVADVTDAEVDGKSSGPTVDYITLGESVKSEDVEQSDVHDSKQVDQQISEPTVGHVTAGESVNPEEETLQPVLDEDAEPATVAEVDQTSSQLAALDPNNEAVEPEAEEAREPVADVRNITEVDETSSEPTVTHVTSGEPVKYKEDEGKLQPVEDEDAEPATVAEADVTSSERGKHNEIVVPEAEETNDPIENDSKEPVSDVHDIKEVDQKSSESIVSSGESVKPEVSAPAVAVAAPNITAADQTSSEVAALDQNLESVLPEAEVTSQPTANNTREPVEGVHSITEVDGTRPEPTADHNTLADSVKPEEGDETLRPNVDEDAELTAVAEADQTSSEVAALGKLNEPVMPKEEEEIKIPAAEESTETEVPVQNGISSELTGADQQNMLESVILEETEETKASIDDKAQEEVKVPDITAVDLTSSDLTASEDINLDESALPISLTFPEELGKENDSAVNEKTQAPMQFFTQVLLASPDHDLFQDLAQDSDQQSHPEPVDDYQQQLLENESQENSSVDDIDSFNDCLNEADTDIRTRANVNTNQASQCITAADARQRAAMAKARAGLDESFAKAKQSKEDVEEHLWMCTSSQFKLCQEERDQLQQINEQFATEANNELTPVSEAEWNHAAETKQCVAVATKVHQELREQATTAVGACKSNKNLAFY